MSLPTTPVAVISVRMKTSLEIPLDPTKYQSTHRVFTVQVPRWGPRILKIHQKLIYHLE